MVTTGEDVGSSKDGAPAWAEWARGLMIGSLLIDDVPALQVVLGTTKMLN
jgi:hypothetical protein